MGWSVAATHNAYKWDAPRTPLPFILHNSLSAASTRARRRKLTGDRRPASGDLCFRQNMAGMMLKTALRLSREIKAVLLRQPQGQRMFCSKSIEFIEYGFDFGRPMFGPYYGITDAPIQSDGMPSYVDWSKVPGVVGKAWDQWPFGICFLCASLGGMSSVNAIATYATTKESVVLSPQHVLDCNTFSIGSIHGGFVWDVLNFAVKNGGILEASVYPFTGVVDVCKRKMGKGVCIDDWLRVKPNCERALRWTLAHQPATVDIRLLDHVEVDGKMIETAAYTKGLIEGPSYYGSNANHSVLTFGYGESEPGKQGWQGMNSYGEFWGDQGKFWIKRGTKRRGGELGILRYPITPLKWGDSNAIVTARCESCGRCFNNRIP